MSRGTPVTTVRFPPLILGAINAYLLQRSVHPTADYMDRSGFIVQACIEKLKNLKRCAAKRNRKKESVSSPGADKADDCFTPSNTPIVLGEELT